MKTESLLPHAIGLLFAGSAAHAGTYIYAKDGQSAEQQAQDKGGCQVWAQQQQQAQVTAQKNEFSSAFKVCMEGRGYSVSQN